MTKNKGFLTIIIVSATVFFSNACIMSVELVASRLIARHLGSSLYTWTSIIGIVLAGISVGNYIGGRLADRYQPRKALSVLFMLASVACVTIIVLNNIVGEWVWLWQLSWPMRVFSHITLAFLVPSVLLGTISPVAATMALSAGLPTGRTIGEIYAWGTAGSIVGTFLTGFYLIANLGTVLIIWVIAGALLAMGIIYYARMWVLYVWAVIFVLLMTLGMAPYEKAVQIGGDYLLRVKHDPSIIYQNETQYCYVAVQVLGNNPNHLAFMQDKLMHSEILLDAPERLQYFYTKIYAAVTDSLFLEKEDASFLVIGGGGFVFPRYLEKYWPDGRVDVVEIDEGVTEAAHAAFGLNRDTKMNIFSMDARNYVDELIFKRQQGVEIPFYDCIYEDAINDFSVPYQLVTREFNEKIAQLLSDDGIYMVNMIEVYESGLLLGSIINTLQETFPYLAVATEAGISAIDRNTFVVAVSKNQFDMKKLIRQFEAVNNIELDVWFLDDSEIETLTKRSRGLVLTDDFAPVENLLAPVVRKSARDFLATRYMNFADEFKKNQQHTKSIEYYKKAVGALDRYTFKAYNEIGTIYAAQEDWESAANAFRIAIDFSKETVMRANIGSIYFNYGVALTNLEKHQEAQSQFRNAIEAFKEETSRTPTARAYAYMGNAYATLGDFASASEAFSAAIRMNPHDAESYQNLAATFEYQARYDEAIAVCRQLIRLLESQNQDSRQIQQYINHLLQQRDNAKPATD